LGMILPLRKAYFIVFDVIVSGIDFFISLSEILLLMYRNTLIFV